MVPTRAGKYWWAWSKVQFLEGMGGRSVMVLAAVITLGLSHVMRLGYISVKLCCFPGGVKSLSREVPSVSAAFCPSPSALASYLDGLLLFLLLHN